MKRNRRKKNVEVHEETAKEVERKKEEKEKWVPKKQVIDEVKSLRPASNARCCIV